jgi:hypothetical protein
MTADPRQVPTLPVLVEIELATGRTARVTLFLSITSQQREGPETLDEFFNTPRRLLPVFVRDVPPSADPSTAEGDKRELLSRDAIVSARVMSEISPSSDGAVALGVDMIRAQLTNGKFVDGAVKHAQETRVSDFFNAAPEFFAVEDTAGIVYVNKRHVVSISM